MSDRTFYAMNKGELRHELEVQDELTRGSDANWGIRKAIELLDGQPAVEVKEVRYAVWKTIKPFKDKHKCSHCGYRTKFRGEFKNFCPRCGYDCRWAD